VIYWVVVSKRYKKLWKPRGRDDFHDAIFWTKEAAEESACSISNGYMAVKVEMKIIEDTK